MAAFTVTATPGGASFARGVDLFVTVLTNATEAGGASSGSATAAAATPAGSLTPAASGSFVAFCISADGILTMPAATTNNTYDYSPGGHTDQWCGRMGHYSGTVTASSALTYGASGAGADDHENHAAYEIPSSGGTITVDGSSPAGVTTDTGTSVTTASFNPPAGAVLVAMVVAGGSGSGAGITNTITDTSGLGLVWTLRKQSSGSDNFQPTFIYTATVPGGGASSVIDGGARAFIPGFMTGGGFPAFLTSRMGWSPVGLPYDMGPGPVTASLNSTATITASGSVTYSAGATLALSANVGAGNDNGIKSNWFTDYQGNPQLLVSAEDWSVIANGGLNHSGSFTATYDDYLSTRAAQGYTQTYQSWCAFGSTQGTNGGRGSTGADSDGTSPFSTAMDPTTTPNSTFWSRRDYFLNAARANGMRVLLNVTTPYLHQASPNTAPQVSWTSTQWSAFGTFLGNRYANYPGIMWIVGDDYFDDINSNLNTFITALRAAGAKQPLSIQYYQESGSAFDEWSGSATAMASVADWYQGYSYNVSYDVVEKAATQSTSKPYGWFDGYFLQNAASPLTDVQLLRRMIWWALSSGAKGFVTGDDNVWPWASTALGQLTSNSFYTTVVPAIVSYFKALPNWHLLAPDTSSVLVTAGRGTHVSSNVGFYGSNVAGDSDNYVTASRISDGSLAVIYMSKGSTITIDQTKMSSGYTATWVDPKTCATTAATPGSTYNSTAQGNNSDGLNEWVLVLQGTPSLTQGATLTSTATITATGVVGKAATASVSLTDTITANDATLDTTSVAATATLTAAGAVGMASGATISLTGTISAADAALDTAAVSLTATVTAAGAVSGGVGATVAETVAFTAAGILGTVATSSVALTGTITTAGTMAAAGSATVAETVTITAAGVSSGGLGGTVSETVTVTATGVVATSSGTSLPLSDTITAAGAVGLSAGSTTIAETVTVTAAGAISSGVSSQLNATATITAAGSVTGGTSAALAAVTAIVAAGVVAKSAGATLALTTHITAFEVFTPVGILRNPAISHVLSAQLQTLTLADPTESHTLED